MIAGIVLAVLLYLSFGSHYVFSPLEVIRLIFSEPVGDEMQRNSIVLWELRLPRALGSILIGANLAVVGACFQALFRNPLADPYVVGVSSGAAVGGVLALLFGLSAGWGLGSMGFAFLTAIAALGLVMLIARAQGTLNLSTLLIAGVAVGSFLWALITFLLISSGQDAGKVLFWLLGDMRAITFQRITTLGFFLLWNNGKALTLFSVDEGSAANMGVSTERVKWIVLLTGSAMAASAVSAVGIIGFVGLFVPHIARRIVGAQLTILIPASAILGAAILLIADLLAMRAIPGVEINIGIVTALIGAPFLLLLLRAKR
jgi:iron complex transport system permease protein